MHAEIAGPIQPASGLGVCDAALYLLTASGTVLAVVAREAVRLPCAIVLPHPAAELVLPRIAPGSRPVSVGLGRIAWAGPRGEVTIDCRRQWAPPRAPSGRPRSDEVALARAGGHGDIGIDREYVRTLAEAGDDPAGQFAAARALLGRGPGLTPSGDDVLAGWLLAARAFDRPRDGVEEAVRSSATRATTALSAQLLRHAMRGEGVAELVAVLAWLVGRGDASSLARLLAIGHTSGPALAAGALAAVPVGRPVGALR